MYPLIDPTDTEEIELLSRYLHRRGLSIHVVVNSPCNRNGDGYGDGYGTGNGYGIGNGDGYGYGKGSGSGEESIKGNGYGYGCEDGFWDGSGDENGDGFGDGGGDLPRGLRQGRSRSSRKGLLCRILISQYLCYLFEERTCLRSEKNHGI